MKRVLAIKDFAEFIRTGKTPSTKETQYFDGEIQWFTPGDLDTAKQLLSSKRTLTKLAFSDKKAARFPPDTLLVSCIGDIGKLGITSEQCSSNQQITGIKPKNDVDVHYLYYWFKQNKKFLQNYANNAVVPILNNRSLEQIQIPIPPIAEQKQIAAILDAADSLRQKDQQLVEHYTALSQSLFLEMFGEPISNPRQWEKASLEKLVDRVIDCPHSTPRWTENGIVAVRTSNLTQGDWLWDDKRFVSESEFHERSKRAYVKSGDIVLSREGTIGVAAIVKDDMKICLGQRLVQLIPNLDIANNHYLLHLLLYELAPGRIGKVMVGATSKHLNVKELRSLMMITPPLELQNQFAERVAIIEKQKQQAQANLKKSEALFNSLLQRAFTGELTADKAA